MIYSSDRILTTHAGSLPRPDDLRAMVFAKSRGEPYDQAALERRLSAAVAEIVRQQVQHGLDSVNDGELSKSNFTDYVRMRLAGYETRPAAAHRRLEITARDAPKFPGYFEANPRNQIPRCADGSRLHRQAALYRTGRSQARPRQFPGGARRRQDRGSLSAGQHAGHDRALDGQRILQERRGIRVRDRRCDARGIPGDRRCRLPAPDRRSGPSATAGIACPT